MAPFTLHLAPFTLHLAPFISIYLTPVYLPLFSCIYPPFSSIYPPFSSIYPPFPLNPYFKEFQDVQDRPPKTHLGDPPGDSQRLPKTPPRYPPLDAINLKSQTSYLKPRISNLKSSVLNSQTSRNWTLHLEPPHLNSQISSLTKLKNLKSQISNHKSSILNSQTSNLKIPNH